MIEVGNDNKTIKNKDRWNHCNHIPKQSLLGDNHRLPLFHMAKSLFGLNKQKTFNKFYIGYMINPTLNINKAFR